ncbi:MAG: hypothetical protein WC222_03995 [Parachlamydiales bacterium]|jgi:hypothetical protein
MTSIYNNNLSVNSSNFCSLDIYDPIRNIPTGAPPLILPRESSGDRGRAYALNTRLIDNTANFTNTPPPFDNSILDMEILCKNVKDYLVNTKFGTKTLIERWIAIREGAKYRSKDIPAEKKPPLPKFCIVGSTAIEVLDEENRTRIFNHAQVEALNTDFAKENLGKKSNDLDVRAIPAVTSWDENIKMLVDFLLASSSQQQRSLYYEEEWGVLENLLTEILRYTVVPTLGEYFLVRQPKVDQGIGTPKTPFLADSSNLWLEIDPDSLTPSGDNLKIKVVCGNNAHPAKALVHKAYGYFDLDPKGKNYTAPIVYCSAMVADKRTISRAKLEELISSLILVWKIKKADQIAVTLRNVVQSHHKQSVDEALAVVLLKLECAINALNVEGKPPVISSALFQEVWRNLFLNNERNGNSLLEVILKLRLDSKCPAELINAFLTVVGAAYLAMPYDGLNYDENEVIYTEQEGVPSAQFKVGTDVYLHLPLDFEKAVEVIEKYYLANAREIPSEVSTLVFGLLEKICDNELFDGFGPSRLYQFKTKIPSSFTDVKVALQTWSESPSPVLRAAAAHMWAVYSELGDAEAMKSLFLHDMLNLDDKIRNYIILKILCVQSPETQWGLIEHECERQNIPHALAATRKPELCRLAMEMQQKKVSKSFFHLLLEADAAAALDYLDRIKDEEEAKALTEVFIDKCFQKAPREILQAKFEVLYAIAPHNSHVIRFCISDRQDMLADLLVKVRDNSVGMNKHDLFECCLKAVSLPKTDKMTIIEILESEKESLADLWQRCEKEIILPIAMELLSSEDIAFVEAGKNLKEQLKKELSNAELAPLLDPAFKIHYRLVSLESTVRLKKSDEAVKKLFKLAAMPLDAAAKVRLEAAALSLTTHLISEISTPHAVELLARIFVNPDLKTFDKIHRSIWIGCSAYIIQSKEATEDKYSKSIPALLQISLKWLEITPSIHKTELKNHTDSLLALLSLLQKLPVNIPQVILLYRALSNHTQIKIKFHSIELTGLNLIHFFETALKEKYLDLAGFALNKLLTDSKEMKFLESSPHSLKRRLIRSFARQWKNDPSQLKQAANWLKSSNRIFLGDSIWLGCVCRWLHEVNRLQDHIGSEVVEKVIKEWMDYVRNNKEHVDPSKNTVLVLTLLSLLEKPNYSNLKSLFTQDILLVMYCSLSLRHSAQRNAMQKLHSLALSVGAILSSNVDSPKNNVFLIQVFRRLWKEEKFKEALLIFEQFANAFNEKGQKIASSMAFEILECIELMEGNACTECILELLIKLKDSVEGSSTHAYWKYCFKSLFRFSCAKENFVLAAKICLFSDDLKDLTDAVIKGLLVKLDLQKFDYINQLLKKNPHKCSLQMWKQIWVIGTSKKLYAELLECYPLFSVSYPFKGGDPLLEEIYALVLNVLFLQESPLLPLFLNANLQQLEQMSLRSTTNSSLRLHLSQLLLDRLLTGEYVEGQGKRIWSLWLNLKQLPLDVNITEKYAASLFAYSFKHRDDFLIENILEHYKERIKSDPASVRKKYEEQLNALEHWPEHFNTKFYLFLFILYVNAGQMVSYDVTLNWLLRHVENKEAGFFTFYLFSQFSKFYPLQCANFIEQNSQKFDALIDVLACSEQNFNEIYSILAQIYQSDAIAKDKYGKLLSKLFSLHFVLDENNPNPLCVDRERMDKFLDSAAHLTQSSEYKDYYTSSVITTCRILTSKEDLSVFLNYSNRIINLIDVKAPDQNLVTTFVLQISQAVQSRMLTREQRTVANSVLMLLLKCFAEVKCVLDNGTLELVYDTIEHLVLSSSFENPVNVEKILPLLNILKRDPMLLIALEIFSQDSSFILKKYDNKQILSGIKYLFIKAAHADPVPFGVLFGIIKRYSNVKDILKDNADEQISLLEHLYLFGSSVDEILLVLNYINNNQHVLGERWSSGNKSKALGLHFICLRKFLNVNSSHFTSLQISYEQLISAFQAFHRLIKKDFFVLNSNDTSNRELFHNFASMTLDTMKFCLMNSTSFNDKQSELIQFILNNIYHLCVKPISRSQFLREDMELSKKLLTICVEVTAIAERCGGINRNWLCGVYIQGSIIQHPLDIFPFLSNEARDYAIIHFLKVYSAETALREAFDYCDRSESKESMLLCLDYISRIVLEVNQSNDCNDIPDELRQRHKDLLLAIVKQSLTLNERKSHLVHLTTLSNKGYFKQDIEAVHETILNAMEILILEEEKGFCSTLIKLMDGFEFWLKEPIRNEKVAFCIKNKGVIFGNEFVKETLCKTITAFVEHQVKTQQEAYLSWITSFLFLMDDLSERNRVIRLCVQGALLNEQYEYALIFINILKDDFGDADKKSVDTVFTMLLRSPIFAGSTEILFSTQLVYLLTHPVYQNIFQRYSLSLEILTLLRLRAMRDGENGNVANDILEKMLLRTIKSDIEKRALKKALSKEYMDTLVDTLGMITEQKNKRKERELDSDELQVYKEIFVLLWNNTSQTIRDNSLLLLTLGFCTKETLDSLDDKVKDLIKRSLLTYLKTVFKDKKTTRLKEFKDILDEIFLQDLCDIKTLIFGIEFYYEMAEAFYKQGLVPDTFMWLDKYLSAYQETNFENLPSDIHKKVDFIFHLSLKHKEWFTLCTLVDLIEKTHPEKQAKAYFKKVQNFTSLEESLSFVKELDEMKWIADIFPVKSLLQKYLRPDSLKDITLIFEIVELYKIFDASIWNEILLIIQKCNVENIDSNVIQLIQRISMERKFADNLSLQARLFSALLTVFNKSKIHLELPLEITEENLDKLAAHSSEIKAEVLENGSYLKAYNAETLNRLLNILLNNPAFSRYDGMYLRQIIQANDMETIVKALRLVQRHLQDQDPKIFLQMYALLLKRALDIVKQGNTVTKEFLKVTKQINAILMKSTQITPLFFTYVVSLAGFGYDKLYYEAVELFDFTLEYVQSSLLMNELKRFNEAKESIFQALSQTGAPLVVCKVWGKAKDKGLIAKEEYENGMILILELVLKCHVSPFCSDPNFELLWTNALGKIFDGIEGRKDAPRIARAFIQPLVLHYISTGKKAEAEKLFRKVIDIFAHKTRSKVASSNDPFPQCIESYCWNANRSLALNLMLLDILINQTEKTHLQTNMLLDWGHEIISRLAKTYPLEAEIVGKAFQAYILAPLSQNQHELTYHFSLAMEVMNKDESRGIWEAAPKQAEYIAIISSIINGSDNLPNVMEAEDFYALMKDQVQVKNTFRLEIACRFINVLMPRVNSIVESEVVNNVLLPLVNAACDLEDNIIVLETVVDSANRYINPKDPLNYPLVISISEALQLHFKNSKERNVESEKALGRLVINFFNKFDVSYLLMKDFLKYYRGLNTFINLFAKLTDFCFIQSFTKLIIQKQRDNFDTHSEEYSIRQSLLIHWCETIMNLPMGKKTINYIFENPLLSSSLSENTDFIHKLLGFRKAN